MGRADGDLGGAAGGVDGRGGSHHGGMWRPRLWSVAATTAAVGWSSESRGDHVARANRYIETVSLQLHTAERQSDLGCGTSKFCGFPLSVLALSCLRPLSTYERIIPPRAGTRA